MWKYRDFSKKGFSYVGQLFDLEWKLKNWTTIKNEHHLLESKTLQCLQLVDAWKQSIREKKYKFKWS